MCPPLPELVYSSGWNTYNLTVSSDISDGLTVYLRFGNPCFLGQLITQDPKVGVGIQAAFFPAFFDFYFVPAILLFKAKPSGQGERLYL